MKRKDILLLLIPSFIFVVSWMGFSIYHNFIKSTIPEILNVQILPISPNFDTKTISALKKRTHVDPKYETNPGVVTSDLEETILKQASSSSAKPITPTPTPKANTAINNNSTSGGTLSQ